MIMNCGGRFDFALKLDEHDSLNLKASGLHEPFITERIGRWVEPRSVALDIGAHIGYFTLILSKLVGPTGEVHAFEPFPDSFQLLKGNVELNGAKNVQVHELAITDQFAMKPLFLSENHGDHRLYDSKDGRDAIVVDTDSVFNFFTGRYSRPPDFIKMDIQGNEGWAILGMLPFFQNGRWPVILMEFWPTGLARSGFKPEALFWIMGRYGYRFYDVQEQRQEVVLTEPSEFFDRYPTDPDRQEIRLGDFTNILCVPKNKTVPL